jgi:hypothetical protein
MHIALTPDESETWLTYAHNCRLHIFDATAKPPRQVASILLKDQPGWITFSIDGRGTLGSRAGSSRPGIRSLHFKNP